MRPGIGWWLSFRGKMKEEGCLEQGKPSADRYSDALALTIENAPQKMKKLFTERHQGSKPRVAQTLDSVTRDSLLELVDRRMDQHWFGFAFPEKCGDGYGYAGTDFNKLEDHMKLWGVIWPAAVDRDAPPSDAQIFDLLEYSYEQIAEATNPSYHGFMQHYHHGYDQDSGREKFTDDVNRIFERNGIAYQLKNGETIRFASAVLHESLATAAFRTGDAILDNLLETAREKFLNRSLETRRESLEKIWDAWERLKTLEPGDKKTSVNALLNKAAVEPSFRARLETEARELTDIGNKFMIRHTETDKVPIEISGHVDYLFQRIFAFIRLLLHMTGREAVTGTISSATVDDDTGW